MDISGVVTSQSGNVVLKSRAGEAPQPENFVLRAARRNGNRRQSRRSPSIAEPTGVALRPSRRSAIIEDGDRHSDSRWGDETWPEHRVLRQSQPQRFVTMASRDHEVVLLQGDEVEVSRRGTGGGERSFSYSYSRSSRGARQERSPSPMSVGSSVIEVPKASNTKRRVPTGQSVLQASGQMVKRSKKKVRRRVAKVVGEAKAVALQRPAPHVPAVKPAKPANLAKPVAKLPIKMQPSQAKAPGTLPAQQRIRKRRRTTNSPAPGKEAPPVAPPRRTAAKSAPAPPPSLTVPANVMDIELTPAEQQELKDSVVKHVRQTVQADDDQPDILAEFICVLLDQKKTSSEILEELSVMDDEAQPFVTWLEKEKATLLARRQNRTREHRRSPKAPAEEEALDKPPGQFTPLPGGRSQALLTPNAVTASLEESGKVSTAGMDRQAGLVVITNRLILQPNCGHRPESAIEAEKVAIAEKKAEEAHQKKLDLLAEMTKELQVILQRLSDKSLADVSRERYQTMAQTIQNRMASLSRTAEKAERAYGGDLWQEKLAAPTSSPIGSGFSGGTPPAAATGLSPVPVEIDP